MRAAVLLVALLFAACVAGLAYVVMTPVARRHGRRLRAKARWRTRHYGERGHTVVAVGLALPSGEVLDEHVVARVRDDDPDWNARFLAARAEAEERAFHLNAGEP
jgi:pyridoxamine 5'-phosphate oxidase family protein